MNHQGIFKLTLALLFISAVTSQSLFDSSLFSSISNLRFVRNLDGSIVNSEEDIWGNVGGEHDRLADAQNSYADKRSIPSQGPNPRMISNIVSKISDADADAQPDPLGHSMLFTMFGQFIDHDMARTEDETDENLKQFLNFSLPDNDPRKSQLPNDFEIPLVRSKGRIMQDTEEPIPNRVPLNFETPFLDLSIVYGYDAQWLRVNFRSGTDGKLKVNADGVFPQDSNGDFLHPDKRVNNNPILFAIHVIFHRFHNRLCDQIKALDTGNTLNDELMFTIARNLNIAIYQNIAMYEYSKRLSGTQPAYSGHNPERPPANYLEMNSAAHRAIHSMVAASLRNLSPDSTDSVSMNDLKVDSFKTDPKWTEKMIRGSALTPAKARNLQIVDHLRDRLINTGQSSFLLDVMALDIQRAKDHGMPSFDGMMRHEDLGGINDYAIFGADAANLEQAYGANNANQIDLVYGLMAEPSAQDVDGSQIVCGELCRIIIADNFERFRNVDRFWFERTQFVPSNLQARIKQFTFKDVIEAVYDNGVSGIIDGFLVNGSGGQTPTDPPTNPPEGPEEPEQPEQPEQSEESEEPEQSEGNLTSEEIDGIIQELLRDYTPRQRRRIERYYERTGELPSFIELPSGIEI